MSNWRLFSSIRLCSPRIRLWLSPIFFSSSAACRSSSFCCFSRLASSSFSWLWPLFRLRSFPANSALRMPICSSMASYLWIFPLVEERWFSRAIISPLAFSPSCSRAPISCLSRSSACSWLFFSSSAACRSFSSASRSLWKPETLSSFLRISSSREAILCPNCSRFFAELLICSCSRRTWPSSCCFLRAFPEACSRSSWIFSSRRERLLSISSYSCFVRANASSVVLSSSSALFFFSSVSAICCSVRADSSRNRFISRTFNSSLFFR